MADLSFIVISHNLSGYIEACLASVAAPLFLSTEIIVVDDASTDDTLAKINNFAANKPGLDFRILTTGGDSPRGPGYARNLGASHATSKKIAFVDGDDWISAPAYAGLVTLMDRHDAAMGWLRSLVFHERKAEFWPFYDEDIRSSILAGQKVRVTNISAHPQLGGMEPQCCNRIYDADFLRSVLPFPENMIYEDLPFHFQAVFQARRIVMTDEAGYFYRTQRRGKITDRNNEARFDLVRALTLSNERTFSKQPDTLAGEYVLGFLAQFALWCILSVPPSLRQRLLQDLSQQFQALPDTWKKAALSSGVLTEPRAYMLWLLLHRRLLELEQLSEGSEQAPHLDFLVETGRHAYPDEVAVDSQTKDVSPRIEAHRATWLSRIIPGISSKIVG